MSSSRFSILEAVRKAYVFAASNRGYLLRISVLPFMLHLATVFSLQQYRPGASVIEGFLWGLPANVAFSWLMFAEARFLLLGERVDRLSRGADAPAGRRDAMRLSILILLLFNMAVTAAAAWMDWSISSRRFGADAPVTVSVFLLMGALFWGLRFSVAHILAAVGYPVRSFLRRVNGLEFSFRLMGMGLLCILPLYMLLEIVLELLLSGGGGLTPGQMGVIILVSAPAALIVPLLLNAAAAYALKDLLGGEREVLRP